MSDEKTDDEKYGNQKMVHGCHSKAPTRIVLSRLSTRYPQCYKQVCDFRRSLEKEVEAVYGKIDVTLASEINLACRWELTARVIEQLISTGGSLNVAADIRCAAQATKERAAIIRKLKLRGKQQEKGPANDEWAALDEGADE